jgi:alcohol dehydrogenase
VNAQYDDPVETIKQLTNGGADYVFESVGSETALIQAYHATRRGGMTVTVGLPDPKKVFSIPAVSLVMEERTLKGSYMGSCLPRRDIPRFIEMYRAGDLSVDKLQTHSLQLDNINLGFDRLAQAQAVRQLISFST